MQKKKPTVKRKPVSKVAAYKQSQEVWQKMGRPRLFETPEAMWKAACEYFEWADKNPIYNAQGAGLKRPYTMEGLCIYLNCGHAYFREFKRDKEKCTIEYLTVITNIEKTVYNQKFEGAAVGLFSSNIIARDLGLIDKQQIHETGVVYNTDITSEEAKEIAKGLQEDY